MKLVKAEILWTRVCPLKCSYCAMADGRRNIVEFDKWRDGFIQLKKLGCSFSAFYGAEPLADFDKLPEVIEFAECIGINTTVITSGCVSDLSEKLKTLYNHGLRSITTSYDADNADKSSLRKTDKALSVIEEFKSFGTVRDTAVVVTLTKSNYLFLPDIIGDMTTKGIWTFFDLIHPDRGQPGSKVKETEYSNELYFTKEDIVPLIDVLKIVMQMKEKGFLCHTSKAFVESVKLAMAYFSVTKQPSAIYPFIWQCCEASCFPSWVTVDCDGNVYPCDDFYTKDAPIIKVWNIAERFVEFGEIWKPIIKEKCPGCLWNTHIDSHLIKTGILPITDYIHGMEFKSNDKHGGKK